MCNGCSSAAKGNPLYTEELLAAGLDGRGAAPQSLRDAFMLRIERLSPDAQAAARVIAAGRALDEPTIAEVSGIEPDALHVALREAVSEQVLVACEPTRLSFRHALLREALYDDLLPGERSELHLALARAFEDRADYENDQGVELASAIARHYATAGDQPAALRATVQAALAAREVHAYGDAADLAERALELWPRVPDADQMIPLDHIELLGIAAAAHGVAGDRARVRSAPHASAQGARPRQRAAGATPSCSRGYRAVQWSLNRGSEAVETAERALSMLPADEVSRERASILVWTARVRYLRGRYREALKEGREALDTAVAAGDRRSESEVLNTLGMAGIVTGSIDEGIDSLRRAIDIAREDDDVDGMGTAYSNLADTLSLAGRTSQALETAKEGMAAASRGACAPTTGCRLTVSDLAFEAGDWEAAREHLVPSGAPLVGRQLIFRHLREAELALGVGDEETAADCLEELEPLVARSSEPQWIGAYGALLAESRRRQRDLTGARAAVTYALDRMELCTDDVMRIARVTAAGMRVEARHRRAGPRSAREGRRARRGGARANPHAASARSRVRGRPGRARLASGRRRRAGPRPWSQRPEAVGHGGTRVGGDG